MRCEYEGESPRLLCGLKTSSMMSRQLYRPEWTCGRFDARHSAAIFYNLIEGMSYFFDEHSAAVIGEILSVPRNGTFTAESIAENTGIAVESIKQFLDLLGEHGLVTENLPTEEYISAYRKKTAKNRKESWSSNDGDPMKRLPIQHSTAESDYTDCVGGITSAMFELTYRCSEQCIHCYNPGAARNDKEKSTRGDRREMSLDDYKRVIDELYEEGLVKVCLSGGDPFSKSEVWDIIEYLYEKGIAFDIYTNGQRLFGHEDRLASYYPRLVGVSIYSGEAEDHDFITRVSGSWERSCSVLERLSDLSVPLNIKCCVMRPNVATYRLVEELAKKYAAIPQYEISITDSVDGDKCVSKYLRLTDEEYEIVLRDGNVPLYVGKEAPNYGGADKPLGRNACGAAYNSFCITPEGNLIPCCSFHLVFGNLLKESLVEILNSDKLVWWRSLTLKDYEECGQHDYCSYCNLCPGVNFSEYGSPLKASEAGCHLAKIRKSLAVKMKQGYDPLCGKSLQECLDSVSEEKSEVRRVFE